MSFSYNYGLVLAFDFVYSFRPDPNHIYKQFKTCLLFLDFSVILRARQERTSGLPLTSNKVYFLLSR